MFFVYLCILYVVRQTCNEIYVAVCKNGLIYYLMVYLNINYKFLFL